MVDLLQAKRLTAVVDIGANPITDIPPYQSMLGKRLCSLVGFEPQAEGLASLNAQKSDLETYLPYAMGDGKPATLRLCHAPGMSSLLAPNPQILDCLSLYSIFGMVTAEQQIETHRLDDIAEINEIDFLKIEVQGSELSIFVAGTRTSPTPWRCTPKSVLCSSTRISPCSETSIGSCVRLG